MTPQEIMKQLQAPFPPDEIEWRTQSCGIKDGKPWAKVLCYIQARAIQKRLDEVFGWDGWTEEYRVSNTDIICRLGVKTPEGWIYKENGASNTDIEAFKGGISGAFKRVAASGYGIGRYLYKLEEAFADCSMTKTQGWNQAKTKDKQTIYWKEPQLPSWALPEGYAYPSTQRTGTPQGNPSGTSSQGRTGQNNESGEPVIYCSDCTLAITDKDAKKVKEYSEKTYGQILCRECQKKHKKSA